MSSAIAVSDSRAPRRSHTLPPTIPLASQVGGHAGVQTTQDGSLLLKPALDREVTFYQLVRDGAAPGIDAATVARSGLQALGPWIPKFLGVLSLAGRLAEGGGAPDAVCDVVPAQGTYTPTQMVVLENLAHRFHKPCILDVKLGTVLYDEDAPPEKRARMMRAAESTTSWRTGVRLTGFQVYANDHPEPVVTPKEYGKGITAEQLFEGIARFFPVRLPLAADVSSVAALAAVQPGLPASILLPLLVHLLTALEHLHAALKEAEVRMVGGSVLIVYEGDWERAEEAMRALQDSAPGEVEEEEVEVDDEEEEVEDEQEQAACLFNVALIDFAHTRLVPGEGPDTGVLQGMETLVRLVRQRLEAVQRLVDPM